MYLSNKVRGCLFIVASSLSLIFSFATYASSVDANAVTESPATSGQSTEGQTTDTNSTETSNNEAAIDVRSSLAITNYTQPENLNLDEVVNVANLNSLGDNLTAPDNITGAPIMFKYGMWNIDNSEISGAPSNAQAFAYSPGGFPRLQIHHSGIGRYYARAFNQNSGWSPWINSGEATPNGDPNNKVQAVQIRAKGYGGVLNDIYYKAVLSNGSVTGWGKNGQTVGTIGTDAYIVALKVVMWDKTRDFPESTSGLLLAPFYEGVYRDSSGALKYSKSDDAAYTGWGFENNTPYYFRDGAIQTGWQYIDGYKYYFAEDGQLVTDLEPIMGLTNDYVIKYNKATATMYIMARDGGNGYIIPYKTFMSTDGPDTPLGSFKTYVKYAWKFMHDDIYCQYLSRFYNGFIIHSLLYYNSASPYALDANTYNYMDIAESGGCLRLKAGDAAWVYHNCKLGTPVEIYSNLHDKGPVEKPAIDTPIPTNQKFDPTDPVIVQKQQAEAAKQAAAEAARQAAEQTAGEQNNGA